jgi:hypothetical protein
LFPKLPRCRFPNDLLPFRQGCPERPVLSLEKRHNNAGVGGGEQVRPDVAGNPNNGPKSVTEWFNTAAFVAPAPLSFGSAGRNIVRGPGRDNWNLSMFKMFNGIPFPSRPEGAQIQFRAEFFNAFNHTQFHGVNTSFGGGFGEVNSTYDPRVIQLGMKFLF